MLINITIDSKFIVRVLLNMYIDIILERTSDRSVISEKRNMDKH